MKKINKKIPGILPPPPKTEIDGRVTDLTSKSLPELIELRDRQQKLLKNHLFISKLADNGAKIQALFARLETTIKAKQEEEKTCKLLESLTLNGITKETIQDIEWNGRVEPRPNTYIDSDDDSDPENILHILSQNTVHEKQIKTLPPDKPLLTIKDVEALGDIPHVKYIVQKTETDVKIMSNKQFKPYKSTLSNVHNPEKEILRKKHKYWEVTAATPPPIIHGPAKILSLEESLKLQMDYNNHLKEVEVKHATEKLMLTTGSKMSNFPVNITQFGKYRDVDSDDTEESDPEGSDKEVYDEEPERGGVHFTVTK